MTVQGKHRNWLKNLLYQPKFNHSSGTMDHYCHQYSLACIPAHEIHTSPISIFALCHDLLSKTLLVCDLYLSVLLAPCTEFYLFMLTAQAPLLSPIVFQMNISAHVQYSTCIANTSCCLSLRTKQRGLHWFESFQFPRQCHNPSCCVFPPKDKE